MKKLAFLLPLLIILGCKQKPNPSPTNATPVATSGTPVATQGLPACNPANFPLNKEGSPACCPVPSKESREAEEWHVVMHTVVPSTKANVIAARGSAITAQAIAAGLGHRFIGPACTTEMRGTMTLNFGPCGAAVDPLAAVLADGSDAIVFSPPSGIGCGYQVTKPDGTPYFYPDKYNGQDPLYPPVTPTCLYTVCVAAGIPGVTVTVSTTASAGMGSVHSAPPGIVLSGSGRSSAKFPSDVALIAEPIGTRVRAVFSGDCVSSGEFGHQAECTVKLAPDPKVTVSFQCEPGFTCGQVLPKD